MSDIHLKGLQNSLSFLLVGVGGQGTILASDILAETGLRLGYDVKKAEIHGMSQRGGSVISNLRWAEKVYSPIVSKGTADYLIAFEKLEAVRFSDYLKPGGLILVNQFSIQPVTVNTGGAQYPTDEAIAAGLKRVTSDVFWVDGMGIADSLGNPKTANVVILGALTALLKLPIDVIMAVVEGRVPANALEINRKAFEAGVEAMAVST